MNVYCCAVSILLWVNVATKKKKSKFVFVKDMLLLLLRARGTIPRKKIMTFMILSLTGGH